MMEIHGLRFYQVAAERCTNPAAREMFSDLANDEIRHRKELERQFRAVLKEGKWSPPPAAEKKDLRFKNPVIDADLKKHVEETWFDSAALNIGMMLEKRAMEFYTEQEKSAQDPDTKAMFQWLASWEKGHLDRLTALERAMREEIWNAAQFWPLD
jgi:rubrerythrin